MNDWIDGGRVYVLILEKWMKFASSFVHIHDQTSSSLFHFLSATESADCLYGDVMIVE